MSRDALRRERDYPVKKFVHCVKKHRCLYDVSNENYSNRREVDKAWADVATEMNDTDRYCRERWKNIRTVFVRQLKNRTGKLPRRSYYLEKELKFLIPHLKKKDEYQAEYNRLLDEVAANEPDHNDAESDDQNMNCKNEFHIEEDFEGEDSLMAGDVSYIEEPSCDPIADTPLRTNENNKVNSNNSYSNVNNLQNDLSSDEYFLLGLLPEFTSLTAKRKRQFKVKIINLLNDLHEEQENEMNDS